MVTLRRAQQAPQGGSRPLVWLLRQCGPGDEQPISDHEFVWRHFQGHAELIP
jgi:hypothetical protein